jgi:hypothetical protein
MSGVPVLRSQNLDVGSHRFSVEDCAWSVTVSYSRRGKPRLVAFSEWFPEPSCSRIIFFIYPGSIEEVRKCAQVFRNVSGSRRPSTQNPYRNDKKYIAIGIAPDCVFQIIYVPKGELKIPIADLKEFLEVNRQSAIK